MSQEHGAAFDPTQPTDVSSVQEETTSFCRQRPIRSCTAQLQGATAAGTAVGEAPAAPPAAWMASEHCCLSQAEPGSVAKGSNSPATETQPGLNGLAAA